MFEVVFPYDDRKRTGMHIPAVSATPTHGDAYPGPPMAVEIQIAYEAAAVVHKQYLEPGDVAQLIFFGQREELEPLQTAVETAKPQDLENPLHIEWVQEQDISEPEVYFHILPNITSV